MKRLAMLLLIVLMLCGCAKPAAPTEAPTLPPSTEAALPTQLPTLPPTEAPTEPSSEEMARATVLAAGDVLPHLGVINAGKTGDGYCFDSCFSHIADLVSQADFAVANLETTLAGLEGGYRYSGFPRFNCPDEMADAIKNAGFDMLLTCNNHAYDTDGYGALRTLQVLDEKELLSLGTLTSAEEPGYRVVEVNGIKIGMVCYSYGEINAETGRKSLNGIPIDREYTGLFHVFDYARLELFYEEMEQHLADMKAEGAEATVVFIHWGNEYRTQENDHQQGIARGLCELGIDVIIGGHPHVVQGAELLESETGHRTLCVYSVGNLVSNQRREYISAKRTGHTEDGLIAGFTFVKYSDGRVHLEEVQLVPIWVAMGASGRAYQVIPLEGDSGDWAERFDLTRRDAEEAAKSRERTEKIVAEDLAVITAELERLRQLRYEEVYGVG